MENKYFTPDIEDFHVGYECEVNWNRAYTDVFEPIILKICEELPDGWRNCYCSNVDGVLIAYDDGCAEFRTLYLTKEQIEAEGWEFIKHHAGTEHCDFEKDKYSLAVDFNFRGNIHLRIYEGEQDNEFNYFSGKCKDINTFRKICKLLEI